MVSTDTEHPMHVRRWLLSQPGTHESPGEYSASEQAPLTIPEAETDPPSVETSTIRMPDIGPPVSVPGDARANTFPFGDWMNFAPCEAAPRDYDERITACYAAGRSLIRSADKTVKEQEFLETINAFIQGSEYFAEAETVAWKGSLIGILYFALMHEIRTHEGRLHLFHVMGARVQRHFMQALVRMIPADRKRLYNSFDNRKDADLRLAWSDNIKGAVAAARVAACFNGLGIKTIAPIEKVDIHYAVDLLIELPDHVFACIQIKSQRKFYSSCVIICDEHSQGMLQPHLEELRRRFTLFACTYNLACIGAYIRVGIGGVLPWEIQSSESLRHALRVFLP